MLELTQLDKPTCFICHFKTQEGMPGMPYYQATFDPADQHKISPDEQFIRFDHSETCELNGWRKWDDLVIDTILEVDEVDQAVNG